MTNIPYPDDARFKFAHRVGPMVWVWVTLVLAMMFSGALFWIQHRQQRLFDYFSVEQTLLKQARIDLAEGYLHISLANSPQSPFDRSEGLALLEQASTALTRALGMRRAFSEEWQSANEAASSQLASYAQTLSEFHDLLNRHGAILNNDPTLQTKLRILFFALERQAQAVDERIQRDIAQAIHRYEQFQTLILSVAALGVSVICLAVYAGGRAQKQAEQDLRDSEIRFRALVEQALAGIYVVRDERFCYVNPGFASIFGYATQDELIDRTPVFELVVPEQREQVRGYLQRCMDGEIDVIRYTFTGQHRNGGRIDIEVHSRVFDYHGRPAIIGMILDITARKVAEAQLRVSEERLQLALEATSDGLWDRDFRSGLDYLSPRYYQITGYRIGEVRPDFEFFKRTVHPEDLSRALTAISAHTLGKTPSSDFDYRLLTPSGEIKWVRLRGQVVERDEMGKPLRMVGTITDISERKAVEGALRRQAEELAERNSELERFNQAMIGRELDMIALKRQVNRLSAELGREPPFELSQMESAEISATERRA